MKTASKPPAKRKRYCAFKPLNSTVRPTPLLISNAAIALQEETSQNCGSHNEKDVKETIRQLQDSDLLDKYKENIAKMQGEQTSLLEKIRKAEEQSEQQAMLFSQNSIPTDSSASDTSSDNDDDKPLSYYL